MTRQIAVLAFFILLTAPFGARGQEAAADAPLERLALETERVVVFKDGYALVVKRAVAVSNAEGEVFTEEVPDSAVLGTFWAVPVEGEILSMDAGLVETKTEITSQVPLGDYVSLLRENLNRKCRIELDDHTVVAGAVKAASPNLFVLASEQGEVVLPISRIRRLDMDDMLLSIPASRTETKLSKRLTFRFAGGKARRELVIVYFRPGVQWYPTYRIGLAGEEAAEKKASLTMQAEILNKAEDLVDVPLDVVVGVPNFRFKDTVSPFVLERVLVNALYQAAPQLMGQQGMSNSNFLSNGSFGSRGGERGAPRFAGPSADLPAELAEGRSQDLFVYHLPKMTIEKGHRAAVPVIDEEVPYRDVYTWDLRLTRADVETGPGGQGISPLSISQNRVWHQIELTNNTGAPWTTGAAMMLTGWQPQAQELLTYTPSGAKVRVPVTVAVDLRGEFTEEETGRELKAMKWNGYDHARIDKRGTIRITNYKGHPVDIEIVARLGGRATEATGGGETTVGTFDPADWQHYRGHPSLNNHSTVFWKLTLEKGETKDVMVAYHYFARH